MKNKKIFPLALAGMIGLGTLAAASSVMAEETTTKAGKTTVTVTKEDEKPNAPAYELSVPARLEVTSAGFTKAENVKVTSDADKFTGEVVVRASASGKFQEKNDAGKTLAYTLNKDENTPLQEMVFRASDAIVSGDTYAINSSGAEFGVYIKDADWNAADDGTYTDTVSFVAEYYNE